MDVFETLLLSDVQVNRGSSQLTKISFKSKSSESIVIDLVAKKISQTTPMEFIQDRSKLLLKVPSSFNGVEVEFARSPGLYLLVSGGADDKVSKYLIDPNATSRTFDIEPNSIGKLTIQLTENKLALSRLSVHIFADNSFSPPSKIEEKPVPAVFPTPSTSPFPVSMEDGPVFRETLSDYETKITALKQATKSTIDYLSNYESLSNQLLSSRTTLISSFSTIQSNFPTFYSCEFDKEMVKLFQNLTDENKSAIKRLRSKLPFTDNLSGLETSVASKKRIFEEESKRYYDWLSKLLSSGKSKDEKFLMKRKAFELAKIDFFAYLLDTLVGLTLNFCNRDNSFISSYNTSKTQRKKSRQAIEKASSMAELNSELSKLNGLPGPNKSGILFTQGGQGKSGWHKQWIVLNNGRLSEFMDWRKGTSRRNDPIDISLCSIKPLDLEKRKNCFRIITNTGIEHYFQATTEEDRESWIQALYDAGQQINFHKAKTDSAKNSPVLNVHKLRNTLTPGRSSKEAVIADEGRQRRVSSVSLENLRIVQKVDSSNFMCSECGSSDSVEWVSMNLLVVFCVKCSSCHRSLGTSISKVRSLKLDVFTVEARALLHSINNRSTNAVYEELLPKSGRINPDSSDKDRLKFITEKYVAKQYVNRKDAAKASDFLIHGVRTHNLQEVIKSLALGVDRDLRLYKPTDQLSDLEPVSFSVLEYVLLYPLLEGKDKTIKVFDLAEFLILNGTKCGDSTQNVLGLSDEALAYWQAKIDRLKGSASKSSPVSVSVPTASSLTTGTTKPAVKEHKFNLLKKMKS
ncbi:hypothetical protein OGAPHI_002600 [Ogataea philodendri]|uniref:ADP-ribosylation factor GTPase-activating protein n=1 Tax=Ogataea philodendri TaxID=1378263 RepID=A0A9P8PC42_9ASCO|nr:uncharacterized protein OGAPHI_002600 [Ogataea philodendri]KAH3668845.1 hypothetical protein OGAPHI_002600 [Ogataea philodendri]